MKRILQLGAGLLLAAVTTFAGCTNLEIGRRIPQDQLIRLDPGRTTVSEVQEWFGTPYAQPQSETGKIFVYRYISHDQSVCQELIISFSEDDTICVFSKEGL